MIEVIAAGISVYIFVGSTLGLGLLRWDWRLGYAVSVALVWPLLPVLVMAAAVERAYIAVRLLGKW